MSYDTAIDGSSNRAKVYWRLMVVAVLLVGKGRGRGTGRGRGMAGAAVGAAVVNQVLLLCDCHVIAI